MIEQQKILNGATRPVDYTAENVNQALAFLVARQSAAIDALELAVERLGIKMRIATDRAWLENAAEERADLQQQIEAINKQIEAAEQSNAEYLAEPIDDINQLESRAKVARRRMGMVSELERALERKQDQLADLPERIQRTQAAIAEYERRLAETPESLFELMMRVESTRGESNGH